MHKAAPSHDQGDDDIEVGSPRVDAAGVGGVTRAMRHVVAQMGIRRGARALLEVNQADGFDCPGCAWPEPGDRSHAEFCENGAKAVAEEATLRRVDGDFFARHTVADLAGRSDHWLGPAGTAHRAGRAAAGGRPLRGRRLGRGLRPRRRRAAAPSTTPTAPSSTRRAAPATRPPSSTSCFVRAFGTNNLPDCSNMCHESSGVALSETIGVGKGTVTLDDIHHADLLIVVGPEPGHQPPADAHRPRDGQGERGPDRRRQPAARGGAAPVPQPPDGPRRRRPGHRARRPLPPDPGQRRPGPVPGRRRALIEEDRVAVAAGHRPVLDHDFIDRAHRRLRRLRRPRRRPRLGRGRRGDRPDPRRRRGPGAARSWPPTGSSSAGRWASPSTATRWPRSARSSTSCCCGATSAGPAPGSARCGATATCRATARWASTRSRRRPSSTRSERRVRLRAAPPPGYDTVDAIRAMRDGRASTCSSAMGGNFVAAAPDTDGDRRRPSGAAG